MEQIVRSVTPGKLLPDPDWWMGSGLEYVDSSEGSLLFKVTNFGMIESVLTLSATQLNPGQFLTIKHESIKEGKEVKVTFQDTAGYKVTIKTL